jgi:hypothetical protein
MLRKAHEHHLFDFWMLQQFGPHRFQCYSARLLNG